MLKLTIRGQTIWVKEWAAYHPTADAHEQDITIPVTTGAAIDGQYITLTDAGDETKYVVWFNVPTAAEVSTVQAIDDVGGALGGKYFTLNSLTTKYYVWMSIGEKQQNTYTARADSGGDLDNKYFTFYTLDANNGTNVKWGVWYDVDDAGGAPVMSGVLTANEIEVDIATGELIGAVSSLTKAAIETALGSLATVTLSTNDTIITNTYFGTVTAPITDGDVGGGAVFDDTNAGVADSTDPAIGGLTGLKVNFDEDAVANTTIADAIEVIVHAQADFSASATTHTVTITHAATGNPVDLHAANSGFTVAVTTGGYTDLLTTKDPQLAYTTSVPVSLVGDDTNTEIAAKLATALDALANFGASESSNVVSIVNAANGECTTAVKGTTSGWTFANTTVGSAGYLPGTSSGDWIKITGKIQGTDTSGTPIEGKWDAITKWVPAVTLTEIEETNM